MILADTSVWVAHLDRGDERLAARLMRGEVVMHSSIIGELACGDLRPRGESLAIFGAMPRVVEATHTEALALLERERLHCSGLGWVDVHLLASALLSRARILTDDRALQAAARRLGVAA